MVEPVHEDRALFLEALDFTSAKTGFPTQLIEKDFFCTLLLAHLVEAAPALVFKGGTCIAKVHTELYRLSEDMDFAIPMSTDAPRSERRRRATPLKSVVRGIPRALPCFRVSAQLVGANNSRQYAAAVTYQSVATGSVDSIKIEVSLREPMLAHVKPQAAATALLDPVTGAPMVKIVLAPCISLEEALAEKFRAALTRRESAIRDFYDIDYALRIGADCSARRLVEMVRQKLDVPGTEAIDVSTERLAGLERQVGARLRPVLRPADFDAFDLGRASKAVVTMAEAVRELVRSSRWEVFESSTIARI